MVVNRSLKYALLASFAALSGCAGLSNGAPPVVQIRNGELVSDGALERIRAAIGTDCLRVDGPARPPADAKAHRNRLVTAYMFGVDLAYNGYERNLLDAVRENDLGASTASLALSSIGAVVGDAALAQALSTTNAIVTGTHSAIGRDYLFSMTLNTLQTQMRATRASQRALILRRLQLEHQDWDSCTALSDVLVYEQAGTLNAALAEAAAAAAEANDEGQAAVEAAIPTAAYDRGRQATALRDYVFPADEALWAARIAVGERIVGAQNLFPDASLSVRTRLLRLLYVADPALDADRRRLVQALIDDTTVAEDLKTPLRAAIAQ